MARCGSCAMCQRFGTMRHMAEPKPCGLCGGSKVFRRDLCRCCYRKLAQCGIDLPPAAKPGPSTSLERVIALWIARSPQVRDVLTAALEGAA